MANKIKEVFFIYNEDMECNTFYDSLDEAKALVEDGDKILRISEVIEVEQKMSYRSGKLTDLL